jgi:hypothetical protein
MGLDTMSSNKINPIQMKKQFLLAAALFAATVITTNAIAQDGADAAKNAGWNVKENVKCRVSSSSTGCDVVFTQAVQSPRDAASGQATGKRQHKPFSFSVSSADNTVTESSSSMASAKSSGGGAGKATLNDISFMITLKGKQQKLDVTDGEVSLPADLPDGSCDAIVSWSWGVSNSSSTKRCSVSFTLQIEDGVCHAINEKGLPGNKGTTKN